MTEQAIQQLAKDYDTACSNYCKAMVAMWQVVVFNDYIANDYYNFRMGSIDYALCIEDVRLFDGITKDDLIMAFYPCVYFCESSQLAFTFKWYNYRNLNEEEKIRQILNRSEKREYYYTTLIKLFGIAYERNLRLIVENPYNPAGYLTFTHNFVMPPTLIDRNRTLRGDYFIKPTAYYFVNCTPTNGRSEQNIHKPKSIKGGGLRRSTNSGICSADRSMISSDYARNFICDFVLGKEQRNSEQTLF